MPRHYQPFVWQIRPTLATLPNLSSDLAKPAAPAMTLKYAKPDYVNQVRPTLAALPLLAASDFSPASLKSQPQDYLQCDFVSQSNPTLAIIARLSPSEFSLVSSKAQPPVYRQCDWTGQVRPTLATLPSPTSFLAYIAPNAQPQSFDKSKLTAPDKFGIVTAATPTLASWTSTVGANMQPLDYDRGSFIGAEKSLPVQAVTLSGWASSTDLRPAIKLPFARAEAQIAPAKVLPFVETVTVDKWRQIEPAPRYRARFEPSQRYTAPLSAFPFVPIPGPFVGVAKGFAVTDTLVADMAMTEMLEARVAMSRTMSGSLSLRQGLSAKGVTSTTSLVAATFTIVAIQ